MMAAMHNLLENRRTGAAIGVYRGHIHTSVHPLLTHWPHAEA